MSASTIGSDPVTQDGGEGAPSYGSVPAPPEPSTNDSIIDSLPKPSPEAETIPSLEELDISQLSPRVALNLLTGTVASIISTDGGSAPGSRALDGVDVARMIANQDGSIETFIRNAHDNEEVPSHHKTPIGSPESSPQETSNAHHSYFSLDGTLSEWDQQCIAMARRFRSKTPPDVSLDKFLLRIYLHCPMSTAVYLAAAFYIQRVTGALWESEDNLGPWYVQITPLSVHRLVLAALQVATKAFEDHRWSHKRVAEVGGVSKLSLTRLELAMCYLLEFRLFVSADSLRDAAKWMLNSGENLDQGTSHVA